MTTNSPSKVWEECIVAGRENWKLDLVDLSVSWSVQSVLLSKNRSNERDIIYRILFKNNPQISEKNGVR